MSRSLQTLLDFLRRSIPHPDTAALTDAQLLERWTHQHDAAAFELLVWRHGPMVLNSCRRLLPRREDAEDAFQAVFLVLVRKAGSIRRAETLPAWLHRVACRIALRARSTNAQRNRREQPLDASPVAPVVEDSATRDLAALLEAEIDLLPSHYRRAVVLCCLQGKSQEEAARMLNCPRGTVSSWLTRGRERLRQRLLRRGIVVSLAAVTAALTPDAMAHGGLALLAASLIRVAGGVAPASLLSCRTIALAEGMLRMMLMSKVKGVTAGLCVLALLVSGAGTISYSMRAADAPVAEKPEEKPPNSALHHFPARNDSIVREQDGIAWGKAVHGLQAGIGFRPGDQTTYEMGQSITFVVYLRNVGDKRISFSHIEPLFEEFLPSVEDADGNRFRVVGGPLNLGRVPLLHRSLEPQQRIALGYPWFRIRPLGWRGEIVGPTCCVGVGKYKVGFPGLPLRLQGDKADVSGLASGQIEFTLGKIDPAKDDSKARKSRAAVNIRAIYQQIDAARREDRKNTSAPGVIGTMSFDTALLWDRTARQFTELEELIQDTELAAQLTAEQREEIPFALAECYYNLGDYEKALRKYESIVAKVGKKETALRAMGETIKCLSILNESEGVKKHIKKIRAMLDATEGLTDEKRRKWLEWLRIIESTKRKFGDGRIADVGEEKGTGATTRFVISARSLNIPIRLNERQLEQTASVILLVSKDRGATYEQVDLQPATAKGFHFTAPNDGTYWFVIQIVDKRGRLEPANPTRVKPTIEVCVDTTKTSR